MPTHRSSRLVARLLLAALLLLAQHGAWVHELGHLASAQAGAHAQPGSDVPHAPVDLCRLCLVFAQIGSAAAPQAGAMPPATQLAYAQPLAAPNGALRSAALPPRSRDPPALA